MAIVFDLKGTVIPLMPARERKVFLFATIAILKPLIRDELDNGASQVNWGKAAFIATAPGAVCCTSEWMKSCTDIFSLCCSKNMCFGIDLGKLI